ncbi:receptor protein tyrosine phosphatase n [Schistosoma japonicum]|nr:receptor protein tyrosine phosphatase n [Schistosoma japonicum]
MNSLLIEIKLLSDDPMQQPQFREISPLEFQTNQQEEMIIPSDSVTRLRAHKVISGSSKQLERRWIWIKFLNGPLDKSRRVLYFHVPSSAGVSADTIVDALNTKINAIDGYPIEDVGFGRGAVNTVNTRSTTDTTTKSPQPSFLHRSVDDEPFKTTGRIKWERYTMTLVLCSTILAAVLILTTIYLVQICRKKVIGVKGFRIKCTLAFKLYERYIGKLINNAFDIIPNI